MESWINFRLGLQLQSDRQCGRSAQANSIGNVPFIVWAQIAATKRHILLFVCFSSHCNQTHREAQDRADSIRAQSLLSVPKLFNENVLCAGKWATTWSCKEKQDLLRILEWLWLLRGRQRRTFDGLGRRAVQPDVHFQSKSLRSGKPWSGSLINDHGSAWRRSRRRRSLRRRQISRHLRQDRRSGGVQLHQEHHHRRWSRGGAEELSKRWHAWVKMMTRMTLAKSKCSNFSLCLWRYQYCWPRIDWRWDWKGSWSS